MLETQPVFIHTKGIDILKCHEYLITSLFTTLNLSTLFSIGQISLPPHGTMHVQPWSTFLTTAIWLQSALSRPTGDTILEGRDHVECAPNGQCYVMRTCDNDFNVAVGSYVTRQSLSPFNLTAPQQSQYPRNPTTDPTSDICRQPTP